MEPCEASSEAFPSQPVRVPKAIFNRIRVRFIDATLPFLQVGEIGWVKYQGRFVCVLIHKVSKRICTREDVSLVRKLIEQTTLKDTHPHDEANEFPVKSSLNQVLYIRNYLISYCAWSPKYRHWIDSPYVLKSNRSNLEHAYTINSKAVTGKTNTLPLFPSEVNNKPIHQSVIHEPESDIVSEKPVENGTVMQWVTMPSKLVEYLEYDKELVSNRNRLIALPKEEGDSIRSVARKYFETLNQAAEFYEISNDWNTCNSKQVPVETAVIGLLLDLFDRHFQARSLYDSADELAQMALIKRLYLSDGCSLPSSTIHRGDGRATEGVSDKLTPKLSDVLGVEHFVRFLHSDTMATHFTSRVKLDPHHGSGSDETGDPLAKIVSAVSHFLEYIVINWDTLTSRHVRSEVALRHIGLQ